MFVLPDGNYEWKTNNNKQSLRITTVKVNGNSITRERCLPGLQPNQFEVVV